jgi:hypothetical protein
MADETDACGARAVPEVLIKHVRTQMETVVKGFGEINTNLRKRPNNIEEVAKMREFNNTIPKAIVGLHLQTEELTVRRPALLVSGSVSNHRWGVQPLFDLLEEMGSGLSNEDFRMRWAAFGSAQGVERSVAQLTQQLERDQERFEDDLVGAQEQYMRDLQSVATTVGEFHHYDNVADMAEVRGFAAVVVTCWSLIVWADGDQGEEDPAADPRAGDEGQAVQLGAPALSFSLSVCVA